MNSTALDLYGGNALRFFKKILDAAPKIYKIRKYKLDFCPQIFLLNKGIKFFFLNNNNHVESISYLLVATRLLIVGKIRSTISN